MSGPGPGDTSGAGRPGVGADEALAGFPVALPPGTRPLDQVRLAPVVAGALRAALDSLAGEPAGRAPMRVSADDAVLEVRLERVDGAGLAAAGGVLEAVEASLVPAPHAPRQWIVRTPVLSSVESFLMIERDGLPLALPWHAVSRVRMVRARDLAAVAAQEDTAVAADFGADPRRDDEQPVVLVALGLRRAWLAADRIVWRLPASPDPASPAAPRGGLGPALLTAEGATYWLLEVARILRDVPHPRLPSFEARVPAARARTSAPAARAPAPVAPVAPVPAVSGTSAAPAAELVPVVIPAFEPAPRARLELVTLTGADVTPLDAGALADLGLEESPAAEPAPGAAPARPRALVAEDSITARIFLGRLLEQSGFEVHAITTLAELRAALRPGPWTIAFVDVELPDAPGGRALAGLAPRSGHGTAPVVALVRDTEDERTALAAGVTHVLRKPFERDDLERLLLALGWEARRG